MCRDWVVMKYHCSAPAHDCAQPCMLKKSDVSAAQCDWVTMLYQRGHLDMVDSLMVMGSGPAHQTKVRTLVNTQGRSQRQ